MTPSCPGIPRARANALGSAPPLPGREIAARRRALGLTVDALAHTARIRKSQVSRPDGIALLRIEWVLGRLEDGWSLQQVRQVIEWRLRVDRTPPGTGTWPPSDTLREMPPAVGAPSNVREGGGGRQRPRHV